MANSDYLADRVVMLEKQVAELRLALAEAYQTGSEIGALVMKLKRESGKAIADCGDDV